MSTIDQYLEVINHRLQEENRQGINRSDSEQYLQEMSLKYFREYEVEFEKLEEEEKKNLVLDRVKGFYECLIQIASDDNFDSELEKTCWASFIAAHMILGQSKVDLADYKRVFINEYRKTLEVDFEQLKFALSFLLPIARFYPPVLNFIRRSIVDFSSFEELKFHELMCKLEYIYWPVDLLLDRVRVFMDCGYGKRALEALKLYENLPKDKLRWYHINGSQDIDKNDEMIIDKYRIIILYKLNRYSEAQKYIEDYFLKYGQRLQEEDAEWREYEKNIKNSSDRWEIMQYELLERVRFMDQQDQYSIENIRDNIGKYLLPKSQFSDSDLNLIKGLGNERILLLDDQVPDMPGMLNREMNHAYFADIDGSWYYPSGCSKGRYKIIFKAFSRDRFDNELKSILTSNGLLDSFISTNGQDQLKHIAEEGGEWSKGYIKIEVPRHTSQFGRLIRIILDKRFLDRGVSDLVLRINEDELEDIGIVSHFKGEPFTGISYSLNSNGSVAEEIEYVNGLKHGMYSVNDLDGNLLGQVKCIDDEFADEGQEKEYFELTYRKLSPIIQLEDSDDEVILIQINLLIHCRRFPEAKEKLELYHSKYPVCQESKELEQQIKNH